MIIPQQLIKLGFFKQHDGQHDAWAQSYYKVYGVL